MFCVTCLIYFYFLIQQLVLLCSLSYTRLKFLTSFLNFVKLCSCPVLCPHHHPGFLQVTPGGSPQTHPPGEADASVVLQSSGPDVTTQHRSEEHQLSCCKEAAVTVVTRTTTITQQQVTGQTTSDQSLVTDTNTRQLTGDQL